MPLLGPHMAAAIVLELTTKGFVGPAMPSMASAIAVGSVLSVAGKAFATADTGTVPGGGVGVGVGITGVPASGVAGFIATEAAARGLVPTPQATIVYNAVGNALEAELLLATLASTHTPVFAGLGVIVAGSIPVSASGWGGNITTTGVGLGLGGIKWPSFAGAIGAGCADAFSTATGQVVIAGTPTSPTTVPGSGSGTGIIT